MLKFRQVAQLIVRIFSWCDYLGYVWVLQDFPVINFIHTVRPNWPPSRKREEAQVLENLQKLVERSELFKAYQSTGSEGLTTAKLTQLNNNQHESLDNRPELLRKVSFFLSVCLNRSFCF